MKQFLRNIKQAGQQSRQQLKLLVLKGFLGGRFSPEKAFIITSSPRSGSTWLSELLLAGIPCSCSFFEPLQIRYVPEAVMAGLEWRTHKAIGEDWPEGKNFLTKVFRGQIVNHWTTREITIPRALIANKIIIKFVRLNRLLPWVCKNFELPPPVLLIRHPCAVIASQLRSDDWKYTKKPIVPFFIAHRKEWIKIIEETQSVES